MGNAKCITLRAVTTVLVGLLFLGCSERTVYVYPDVTSEKDVGQEQTGPETVIFPDIQRIPEAKIAFEETLDIPPEFLGPECEAGEGCFLDKCKENSDCLAGWCVEHMGEGVCTSNCSEECPAGWTCKQVGATDPDIVFICVSDHSNLCKPCATSDMCKSIGGADDVCVDYGTEGSFCGGLCDDEHDCPWGFTCQDALTIEGMDTKQCVADAGVCPCTGKSVALSLFTPCESTNEHGACAGERVCTESGLTDCNAPEPAQEVCNGLDDDCDDDVDEPAEVGGNYVNLCGDDNDCTEDLCGGEAGCSHEIINAGECIDGDACTVGDHCEEGICVGAPVACDDDNPCTDDLCDGVGGCEFVSNQQDCDDGDPCTVADKCSDKECGGFELDCECQVDQDCGDLEDGDLCNGTLFCDTDKLPHQCVVDDNTIIVCPEPEGDDGICLKSVCAPASGECSIGPVNEGFACDDGDLCTMAEHCVEGSCSDGVATNCNDGNPCTDDACDDATGCSHEANTAACSDGDVCTTEDQCSEGQCMGGPVLGCDDANPCTFDSCSGAVGCVHEPQDGACDDGNPDTTGDECKDGLCVPGDGPVDCDDDNECTYDVHEPGSGCLHIGIWGPCDDDNACTDGDSCIDGECLGGSALDCDDGNLCTEDSCDTDTGCVNELLTPCCGNGLVEKNEDCDETGETQFCTIGCEMKAAILWHSGGTSAMKPFLWCGESGLCAVAVYDRWTDECDDDGAWPGSSQWIRFISPDGIVVGPPVFPEYLVQSMEYGEGEGGAFFGLVNSPNWHLVATTIKPDGSTGDTHVIADNASYSVGSFFQTLRTEDSIWILWEERSVSGNPTLRRVMVRRLGLDGKPMFASQVLADNIAGVAEPVMLTKIDDSVCAFWEQTDEQAYGRKVVKGCLNNYGALSGSVVDAFAPGSIGYHSYSMMRLQSGKFILLIQGHGGKYKDADGDSVWAVLLDNDGEFVKEVQLNQVEQGHQLYPVGAEILPGEIMAFWRTGDAGIRYRRFTDNLDLPFAEQELYDGFSGELNTHLSIAMSKNGNGWFLWKTYGDDSVFQELWGVALRSLCYDKLPCRTSKPDPALACMSPEASAEGTICVADSTCTLAGSCDAKGSCIATDEWEDGSACSIQQGSLDGGECLAGACEPSPIPCPENTPCTEWSYDRLLGCSGQNICCGNGLVEEMEQCDDGPLGSAWCSQSCRALSVNLDDGESEFCWELGAVDTLTAHDGEFYVAWGGGGIGLRLLEMTETPTQWQVDQLSGGWTDIQIAELPNEPGGPLEIDVLYKYGEDKWSADTHDEQGSFWSPSFWQSDCYGHGARGIACDSSASGSACFIPRLNFALCNPKPKDITPRLQIAYSGVVDGAFCEGEKHGACPWELPPRLAISPGGRMGATESCVAETMHFYSFGGPSGCDVQSCDVASPDFDWSENYSTIWLDETKAMVSELKGKAQCSDTFRFCRGFFETPCNSQTWCDAVEDDSLLSFRNLVEPSSKWLTLPSGQKILVFALRRQRGFAQAVIAVAPLAGDGIGAPVILGQIPSAAQFVGPNFVSAGLWNESSLAVVVAEDLEDECDKLYVMRYPLEYVESMLKQ